MQPSLPKNPRSILGSVTLYAEMCSKAASPFSVATPRYSVSLSYENNVYGFMKKDPWSMFKPLWDREI